jgi:hypothetical protein
MLVLAVKAQIKGQAVKANMGLLRESTSTARALLNAATLPKVHKPQHVARL